MFRVSEKLTLELIVRAPYFLSQHIENLYTSYACSMTHMISTFVQVKTLLAKLLRGSLCLLENHLGHLHHGELIGVGLIWSP